MTFADEGVADIVSRRSHEICGQQVSCEVFVKLFCCLIYCYHELVIYILIEGALELYVCMQHLGRYVNSGVGC